jgi:hypothetical protein
LVRRLQRPEQRQSAVGELAAYVDARHVFVFGKDLEIEVYLPALGLPQTLRHGARWHTFLNTYAQHGKLRDILPDPVGPTTYLCSGSRTTIVCAFWYSWMRSRTTNTQRNH